MKTEVMKRFLCSFLVFAGVLISTASFSQTDMTKSFNKMAWIVGNWQSPGTEIVVFERWERASSQGYRFRSVMTIAGDTIFSEQGEVMEKNGVITMTTSIDLEGKDPVPANYRLIKNNGKVLVFENKSLKSQSRMTYGKMGDDAIELTIIGEEEGAPTKEVYKLKRVL